MASGGLPVRYSHTSFMNPSSGLIYVVAGIYLDFDSLNIVNDDIGVRSLYNDVWTLNLNSELS